MDHTEKVSEYYNYNTRKFLKWGDHASSQCIHQPIWREESYSKLEALHYPHLLISEWIEKIQTGSPLVSDFGSGVGGSLHYLSKLLPKVVFTGVTLSSVQNEIAHKAFNNTPNVHCICADFTQIKLTEQQHLIYQIESFNHAPSQWPLIENVSKNLEPNGIWIIFDDFIITNSPHKMIDQYRNGWLVNALSTQKTFEERLAKFDFVIEGQQDLTAYIRLNRTRDKWNKLFQPIIKPLAKVNPYLRSWYGGLGRQYCLANRLIAYKMLVIRKL